MNEFESLTGNIRRFAQERDWEQFHQPRSLVLALVGEVGELAEVVQWKSDEALVSPTEKTAQALCEEVADVAIYLIRLADVLGIDLSSAITEKLLANADKYPVEHSKGRAVKYTELTP